VEKVSDKITAVAAAETGYLEKKSNSQLDSFTENAGSNNYTKYWRDADLWWKWNINGKSSQANPWCACFVSWVFRQAGAEAVITPFYYCPTGVNNFKKAGQWVTSKPQTGDVIFFKDNTGTACHVGIVRSVDNSCVYTIEGNTSNASGVVSNGGGVAKKSYALNYSRILGYGRPNYKVLEELTLTQYEELKGKIEALDKWTNEKLGELAGKIPASPMVWSWIDENMPDWAKPTVEKLYQAGFLRGDENGALNLTNELMRTLVILDRAGSFSLTKGE
jgi:hypothetical protein